MVSNRPADGRAEAEARGRARERARSMRAVVKTKRERATGARGAKSAKRDMG